MDLKEVAAASAVSLVRDGQILGLGTGRTVGRALKLLARRIRDEELEIMGVPTSIATEKEARRLGIPLTTLQEHPALDLDIDGADQVSRRLDLIKGGGGAHFREKIVALASKKFYVIIEEGKLAEALDIPVPVEVLPFSWSLTRKWLDAKGADSKLRKVGGKPVVTDNGNFILDADFGRIEDPKALEAEINSISGVVENGIFADMACEVHVGTKKGPKVLKK